MSRRDTSAARTRIEALLDTLATWRGELDASDRDRRADDGRTVEAMLDAALARRAGLGPADAATLALLEEGLVADAVALATALPHRPPAIPRPSMAGAVRASLARVARQSPGHLIEVRVPPWGAVQIGAPGVASAHTRGTPPNVVETDARTWLALAAGRLSWSDAVAGRLVSASGVHADLAHVLGAAR